ncbi:hypothetical protein SELMODRAFT_448496 [Selaginella moellendorffii]|uniref:Uncharacterized protein n=1 Tax=Selaginella moellendorffii TaxID=88036 RepID=D8T7Q8_SELML|nr:hypothetical protein SELMODRAFT_448496 [Selaginella moellendorffii]
MAMAMFLARKKAASIVLQRDPLPGSTRCLVKSVKHGGKGKKNPDFKRRDPPSPRPGDGSKLSAGPRKNLFDILAGLPDWGMGMKFQKKTWRRDRYFVLTRINLYKSLNHGKAWGMFHENGVLKTGVMRMSGSNKRNWRVIEKPPPERVPWKKLVKEPTTRDLKKKKGALAKYKLRRAAAVAAKKKEPETQAEPGQEDHKSASTCLCAYALRSSKCGALLAAVPSSSAARVATSRSE